MGELGAYIERLQHKPFKWGLNDCLTFANTCVMLQRGRGFADEWIGGYKSARAAYLKYEEERKRSRYENIIDVADDRLERVDTLHPTDGMIVARTARRMAIGYSFGVAWKNMLLFVGPRGLVVSFPQPGDMFWSVT